MGIVLVAFLAARIATSPPATGVNINLETHQLGRKLRSTYRASPQHIGTRRRCSVLLYSQARAAPAELPRGPSGLASWLCNG